MIKKITVFSMIITGYIFIGPQAQADQLQSIMDCTKIGDNISRLACFDAAAQKLSGARQKNIRDKKLTRAKEISNFGKQQLRTSPVKKVREIQKKEEQKELKNIRLKVVRHIYTTTKKFVLFMENGQVWKQKDEGRIRLPKGEFEVEIKKGMIGGFNMIVPTKRSLIKVKRLK